MWSDCRKGLGSSPDSRMSSPKIRGGVFPTHVHLQHTSGHLIVGLLLCSYWGSVSRSRPAYAIDEALLPVGWPGTALTRKNKTIKHKNNKQGAVFSAITLYNHHRPPLYREVGGKDES
jgi:hypothetical protein